MADAVEETVATGTYWDPDTWQDARAAYVADLGNDPDGPDAFVGWLHRAIEEHVARGPAGRAHLKIPAPPGRTGGRGLNRHHPLRASTRAALEEAVVTDRLAGRVLQPIELCPRGRHRRSRPGQDPGRGFPHAGSGSAAESSTATVHLIAAPWTCPRCRTQWPSSAASQPAEAAPR